MLTHHSGSYYEEFRRKKGLTATDLEQQRLLTDRSAYISYLEVQLERVSAACMTSSAFSDRIEQQQQQLYSLEEKIVGLTKLIKLSQQYADTLGTDSAAATADLRRHLDTLRGELQSTSSELSGLRDVSVTAEQEQETRWGHLQASLQDLTAAITQLKDSTHEFATLTHVSQVVHQSAEAADHKHSDLTAKLADVAARVGGVSSDTTQLSAAVQSLSSKLEDVSEHTHQATVSQRSLEQSLQQLSEQLTATSAKLEAAAGASQAAATHAQELSSRLDKLDRKVGNLSKTVQKQNKQQSQQTSEHGAAAGAAAGAAPVGLAITIEELNAWKVQTIAQLTEQITAQVRAAVGVPGPSGAASASPAAEASTDDDNPALLTGSGSVATQISQLRALLAAQTAQLITLKQRTAAAESMCQRLAAESMASTESQNQRVMTALKSVQAQVSAQLSSMNAADIESRILTALTPRLSALEDSMVQEQSKSQRLETQLRDTDAEQQAILNTISVKQQMRAASERESISLLKTEVVKEIRTVLDDVLSGIQRQVQDEIDRLTERDSALRAERTIAFDGMQAQLRVGLAQLNRFSTMYNQTHSELQQRLAESQRMQRDIERSVVSMLGTVPSAASGSGVEADDGAPAGATPAAELPTHDATLPSLDSLLLHPYPVPAAEPVRDASGSIQYAAASSSSNTRPRPTPAAAASSMSDAQKLEWLVSSMTALLNRGARAADETWTSGGVAHVKPKKPSTKRKSSVCKRS